MPGVERLRADEGVHRRAGDGRRHRVERETHRREPPRIADDPGEVAAAVVEAAARARAANDPSWAAAGSLDANLTMREAGVLLGIWHQRIKQLADRTVTATS